MKKLPLFIAVAISASSAFAGSETKVADASAPGITVKYVVGKGKDAISTPDALVKPNESFKVSVSRPVHYPTQWELPKQTKSGSIPYLPITPTSFASEESGWVITSDAELIENGLIRLTGVAVFSEVEAIQGAHGEGTGPIYADSAKKELLTENRSHSLAIQSSRTPFQVFAKPGKAYQFEVRQLGKTAQLQVTCDLQK